MLAAAATATKAVREDVIKKLEMQGCELVYTSPNRPNIYYKNKKNIKNVRIADQQKE